MAANITRHDRLAAIAMQDRMFREDNRVVAGAINDARYVDGFPTSYTDDARRWAERVIAAAAAGRIDRIEVLRKPANYYR